MRYLIQRLGFQLTRGWAVLILLLGALVAAAFWVGPFRAPPPDLRLLALGTDGQFHEAVDLPASWADTAPPEPDVTARLPLVLAVYNSGARPAEPTRLVLSVPGSFRIATSRGTALPGRASAGNPLVRYDFDVAPGRVAPNQLPRVLSSLDTLWLEPVIPSYHCTQIDSVPEFVPAPQQDANVLSQVRIFYSFEAETRARQAGVLSLKLDPALLRRPAVPVPPVYPTRYREPQYPLPVMGALRQAGTRTVQCGDQPGALEIQTVLWETPEAGRFFVVHMGGVPRKYLFDLNRDSIIELEMWDPDRDGQFEAARAARMVIPEFLMPPRVVLARVDSTVSDTLVHGPDVDVDSAIRALPVPRLDHEFPPSLFRDTQAGPFRFWRSLQNARRDTTTRDTTREERAPAGEDQPAATPPRVQPRPPAAPSESVPARPQPTPVRPDTGPRLLGRPVGEPPPVRDTTIRRDTLDSR